MPALPRPDLPAGPHRELIDALHELRHRAGWPSLRTLARAAGCSHTTVSAAFSSSRLPTWGVLELLVETMEGDVPAFNDLWLAAGSPHPTAPSPHARIAGRRDELIQVRHHLHHGSGLLLVTGEAGIGKTRLVTAAGTQTAGSVLVAVGPCLPLASSVPLSAVVHLLRRLDEADPDGLMAAVDASPAYVAPSLSHLLPQLGPHDEGPDDAWARQRLFLAVSSVLEGLHGRRPLALVLEDLHWADPATLDLLEHQLVDVLPGPGGRHVAHGRPGGRGRERRLVVARPPAAAGDPLELAPLSAEETREQLTLLTGRKPEDAVLRRIHGRARGQPLFTEQLAGQVEDDAPLPSLLADLLDDRLGDVDGPSWLAARVLGVAERPLDHLVLGAVCDLRADELSTALHDLRRRRLLAPSSGRDVALRHPLLADAIRRRLVAGERSYVHARLAEALAGLPDPEPGEVAGHWGGAGDEARELPWRVAAARTAAGRFAAREELDHWRRVLDLWPADAVTAGTPAIRLSEVYVRGIDLAEAVSDVEELRLLVAGALRLDVPDAERVEVLRRAGDVECALGDPDAGLALLGDALAVQERLPASPGLFDVLRCRANNLAAVGRSTEAAADMREALRVSEEIGDRSRRRRALSAVAVDLARAGRVDEALDLARQARDSTATHDPFSEVELAENETSILVHAGAPAAAVAEAAAPGLAAVDRWGLTTYAAATLRAQVCHAHLRAGDVTTAAALVDSVTGGHVTYAEWNAHAARATVDVRRGRLAEALARFEAGTALPGPSRSRAPSNRPARGRRARGPASRHRPPPASPRGRRSVMSTDGALGAAELLWVQARAEADLLASRPTGQDDRRAVAHRLASVVRDASRDPFGPEAFGPAVSACADAWAAEVARAAGTGSVEAWSRAATAWDRLLRPHDAAYCRWRAAEVALATTQSGTASRLLGRAARDARGHVPLQAAVRRTGAGR